MKTLKITALASVFALAIALPGAGSSLANHSIAGTHDDPTGYTALNQSNHPWRGMVKSGRMGSIGNDAAEDDPTGYLDMELAGGDEGNSTKPEYMGPPDHDVSNDITGYLSISH